MGLLKNPVHPDSLEAVAGSGDGGCWGAERFRRIFERTVMTCVDAGIAKGEVVHVDASLIRADVSWESLAVRHVEAVEAESGDADPEAQAQAQRRNGRQTGKYKKVCTTDPDASMATNGRNRRLEPSYKQHGVVSAFIATAFAQNDEWAVQRAR